MRKGRIVTEETRAKLRAANIGKVASPETRAKQSARRKGRPLSEEHRAKLSAATKGRAKTPEHIEKIRVARIGWGLANHNPNGLSRAQGERRRHLKTTYGLTESQFAAMLREQDGGCKICRMPERNDRPLNVDHCHSTGRVRGLLCNRCNWILGHANDEVLVLRAAIAYLEASCST